MPKSQLDVLEGMVTQLKEQERIVREAKEESVRANARLDQIETASDHYTVIGYANRFGYGSLSVWRAVLLGRSASKLCRENGAEPRKTQGPRFGRVSTYPKWILDAVFEESR